MLDLSYYWETSIHIYHKHAWKKILLINTQIRPNLRVYKTWTVSSRSLPLYRNEAKTPQPCWPICSQSLRVGTFFFLSLHGNDEGRSCPIASHAPFTSRNDEMYCIWSHSWIFFFFNYIETESLKRFSWIYFIKKDVSKKDIKHMNCKFTDRWMRHGMRQRWAYQGKLKIYHFGHIAILSRATRWRGG